MSSDTWTRRQIFLAFVLFLICIRMFSLAAAYYLPHMGLYQFHTPFLAVHEGDDIPYYLIAESFYNLKPQEHTKTIGFAMLLVPFVVIFGTGFFNVFFPAVLFNGILLFSAAIALMMVTAFLLFKKIAPSVLSGLFFIFFPFVFYVFRDFGPHFGNNTWNDNNFVNALWMSAMAEPLATLLSLLILFLLLWKLEKETVSADYMWLGLLTAFAVMVRMSNITVAAIVFLAIAIYELREKYKKLWYYGFAALIGFIPQFWFNFYFYGSPLSFGYQKEYYTDWIAAGTVRGNPMWESEMFFICLSGPQNIHGFRFPPLFLSRSWFFWVIFTSEKRINDSRLLWFSGLFYPRFFICHS